MTPRQIARSGAVCRVVFARLPNRPTLRTFPPITPPATLERSGRYLPVILTLSLAIAPGLSAQTRTIRTVSADGADAALAAARAEARKR